MLTRDSSHDSNLSIHYRWSRSAADFAAAARSLGAAEEAAAAAAAFLLLWLPSPRAARRIPVVAEILLPSGTTMPQN